MTRALFTLPWLAACASGPMTTAEALEALEQVNRSDAGIQVTADAVEISTEFTLGAAVQAAADELADFWASQVPCTEVTLAGATLTIDYGTLVDSCTWNGKTYAGVSEVEVVNTDDGQVEVTHTWLGLTDGFFEVNGTADVGWDGVALDHDVTTEHTWTEVSTGETVDVTGAHRMGTLAGDGFFDDGITLDGDRQWVGDDGETWELVFSGLEARSIDPAPQAGTMTVTNPAGKQLDITFSRVDETTVRAEVTGTRNPLAFEITALGQVQTVE